MLRLGQSHYDELRRHGFGATVFVVTGHVGGFNDWDAPPPGRGRQAMLSWDDLAELAASGVEIGAHTRSHRNLTTLGDDAIVEEMRASSHSERQGRLIDFDEAGSMEKKKREGYF